MPHKEEGLQRLGDYLVNNEGAKENEKKKKKSGRREQPGSGVLTVSRGDPHFYSLGRFL